MPDLQELLNQLETEPQVEIDWDAAGIVQTPAQVYPGTYEFIFRLPQDSQNQFDLMEIRDGEGKGKYLQVNFNADVIVPNETEPKTVRFQRANTFRTGKMKISSIGDLLRSLGERLGATPSNKELVEACQRLDGRSRGRGELGWRAFCKPCGLTISTNPRKATAKKPAEVPWPRNAEGQYLEVAKCPKCGQSYFAREQFNRFLLPAKQ